MDVVVDEPTHFSADLPAYVAGDAVNLRRTPSTDAAVVAKLPLGTSVEVTADGPGGTIDGRSDRWYAVKVGEETGFLWGGVLTPVQLETDLDRDASREVVTLSFGADHGALLRVLDPDLAGDARVRTLRVGGAAVGTASLEEWSRYGEGFEALEVSVGSAYTLVRHGRDALAPVLAWTAFEGEERYQWVDHAFDAATGTLSQVTRSGTVAADGSVAERVRREQYRWDGATFASAGAPVEHDVVRGPPVESPPTPTRLSPDSPTHEASFDLDGDGVTEAITFSWKDHALTVRVAGRAGAAERAFEPRTRSFGEGFVELGLLGWSAEPGVPMLVVHDPGEEACGSSAYTTYLTYGGGKLREALKTSDWADAPSFSYDAVTFHAKERVAVVTHRQGHDDVSRVTRKVLVLRDGVYVPE